METQTIIGIATYKRPETLRNCLESLFRLNVPDTLRISLVVVDNDASESARDTVSSLKDGSPYPISYLCEPRQGISLARNLILDHAANTDVDLIAFIDDDETAHPNWIAELIKALTEKDADIVTGPVVYTPQDNNINHCGYVPGKKKKTKNNNSADTGNVLFKSSLIKMDRLRFEPSFSRTGGCDYDFFLQANLLGKKVAWTDKAIVYEKVPQARTTLKYILFRTFRSSSNRARSKHLRLGLLTTLREEGQHTIMKTLEGLARLAFTPIFYLTGTNKGKRYFIKSLRCLASGAGAIAGLLNIHTIEYK